MNIFAEMAHSIYDFGSYNGFRRNGSGKTFLYGLVVDMIYILAVFLPMIFSLTTGGGLRNVLASNLPEFTLSGGRLTVEEPAKFTTVNTYLWMDTSRPITEEVTESDLLAFDSAIVMDAEHMLVKSEGQVLRLTYAELEEKLGIEGLNKRTLLDELVPIIYAVLVILAVVFFVGMQLLFFFGALLVAVIGGMLPPGRRIGLSFGELYKLALHARTAPLLLKAVYNFLPFSIPFFFVINFGLSLFYMWKAFQNIELDQQGNQGWQGL